MEAFFETFMAFFDKWWPVVLAIGTSVSIAVGGFLILWFKVKPFFEGYSTLKEKILGKAQQEKDNIANELKSADIETKILDLKSKIASPTIPVDIREGYIKQLTTYETLKAKLDAGLVKVEEVTDTYL